jgi:hypothetical protein
VGAVVNNVKERRRNCRPHYKVYQFNISDADDDDRKNYKANTIAGGNIGDWSQYRHVANVTAPTMEDVFGKMSNPTPKPSYFSHAMNCPLETLLNIVASYILLPGMGLKI